MWLKGMVFIKNYPDLNELKELTQMKCKGSDFSHFLDVENVHTALKVNLGFKVKQI